MFSRFYRPPASWIAFLRKAWQEKIPERSEDDFFPANRARRAALHKKCNPRPLPCKNGKTSSLPSEPELFPVCQEIKKRMRTFRSASFLCIYSPVWDYSSGLQVRKISSVTSPVSSATSPRKTSGMSSPLSMRASRASQPEVSAAFAIPMPLTVS